MEQLRNLMQMNNDSSYDIAHMLGIAQSSAYNYVSGKTEPSIANLIKIADHYGVTVDYLIGHQTKANLSLSLFTDKQQRLISAIKNLNDEQCIKLEGYIEGMQGKDFTPIKWDDIS